MFVQHETEPPAHVVPQPRGPPRQPAKSPAVPAAATANVASKAAASTSSAKHSVAEPISPAVPAPAAANVAGTAAASSNSANNSVGEAKSPVLSAHVEPQPPAPSPEPAKPPAVPASARTKVTGKAAASSSSVNDSVAEPIRPTPRADALLRNMGDSVDRNQEVLTNMARKLWFADLGKPPPNDNVAPAQWHRVPVRKVCTPFLREAVLHNLRCIRRGGSIHF